MERKFIVSVAVLCALVLLSAGCTSHMGRYTREGINERVVLEANNFQIAASGVQASASCAYIFYHDALDLPFIGTIMPRGGIALGEPDLYEQAMANLHAAYAQGIEGQPAMFHNIQEEWTVAGLPPLYGEVTLTLTADVLKFTGDYVDYGTR